MKVSVIIPAFEESDLILDTLDSLEEQRGEVIVVAPDKETRDAAFKHQRCDKVLGDPGGGPGKARNIGADAADGDIILFTDADTHLPSNWVKSHLNHYSDDEVVCVGGSARSIEKGIRGKFSDIYAAIILPVLWKLGFRLLIANNCSFRKETFAKIRGFDEEMEFLEDVEIARRISDHGKVIFDGDIVIEASIRRIQEEGICSMLRIYIKGYWSYFVGDMESSISYH